MGKQIIVSVHYEVGTEPDMVTADLIEALERFVPYMVDSVIITSREVE